jgi:adenylate kinase family enzyme
MVKALAAEGKTKGFLIDGYPRDVLQGEKFEAEVCKLYVNSEIDRPFLRNL